MNRYQPGQQVIALITHFDPTCQVITKGVIYTVNAVQYCSECGIQWVNVTPPVGASCNSTCTCGNKQPNKGLHWSGSSCFAPVEFIDEVIEKAIADEDYELAGELTKQKV